MFKLLSSRPTLHAEQSTGQCLCYMLPSGVHKRVRCLGSQDHNANRCLSGHLHRSSLDSQGFKGQIIKATEKHNYQIQKPVQHLHVCVKRSTSPHPGAARLQKMLPLPGWHSTCSAFASTNIQKKNKKPFILHLPSPG